MALTKSLENRYKFISLASVKRLREGMSVGRSSSTIKLAITVLTSQFNVRHQRPGEFFDDKLLGVDNPWTIQAFRIILCEKQAGSLKLGDCGINHRIK